MEGDHGGHGVGILHQGEAGDHSKVSGHGRVGHGDEFQHHSKVENQADVSYQLSL